MTFVLALGASKSVIFNNTLNVINVATWVFIMTAGMFYVDTATWHEHQGFLPYGWSGVIHENHASGKLNYIHGDLYCVGLHWSSDMFLCFYWIRYYSNDR